MKKSETDIHRLFELDDRIYRLAGDQLLPVDDLADVAGDKWLVTDFKEGMSRLMTVDGPSKYADMLVRRKLQETGEFEEPVEIITHWRRKRSRNSTEIFYTAVPTRLARQYLEDAATGDAVTLIFSMYGVLWHVAQRMAGKDTVAVVLRHDRFAELVIASRRQVFFANRCVVFDTELEQIHTLWESVRADIATVQIEQRIRVARTVCLGWVGANEAPSWGQQSPDATVMLDARELLVDGQRQALSWPVAANTQSAGQSDSRFLEIACYYAQRWAPAANLVMAALLVCLLVGTLINRNTAADLMDDIADVQMAIQQVVAETDKLPLVSPGFPEQLKFIEEMSRQAGGHSYQQIMNDLSVPDLPGLKVQSLTMDYTPSQVNVSLLGNIQAPFDQAHAGYKRFLRRLEHNGYRIEESRFETQISTSQVSLKLIRLIG